MSINVYKKLIKARQNMDRLERSGENKHLKTSYSTLEDIYDACLSPLLEEGLLPIHEQIYKESKLYLITKIVDSESGEFIFAENVINTEMDVQLIGRLLTYLKRYQLSGLLSLRTDKDDDDGESVKGIAVEPQYITEPQYNFLMNLIENKPNKEEIIKYYKTRFKINDLREIPKKDASQIIEIQKNGGK